MNLGSMIKLIVKVILGVEVALWVIILMAMTMNDSSGELIGIVMGYGVVVVIMSALSMFLLYALGEIIDLLTAIKMNTSKKLEGVSGEEVNHHSPENESSAVNTEPAEWFCEKCGVSNSSEYDYCFRCGTQRIKAEATDVSVQREYISPVSSWVCPSCGVKNQHPHPFCIMCGYKREQ